VGMTHAGPSLLGVAPEPDTQYVWHGYEDLGDCILDESAPDAEGVAATIELMSQLHVRFAEHALLGECRASGGDAGMQFYRNSVREAIRSLAGLKPPDSDLTAHRLAVRDRIAGHLNRLLDEELWRGRVMTEFAGWETLLHGDLWPKNTIVCSTAANTRVRFIDWDRVRVGPVTYDLSAFVSRLPAGERAWVVDQYRREMGRAGWQLPSSSELDVLFTTAEYARLANFAIWPPLAVMHGESDWAFEMLATLDDWFNALQSHGILS
jgi:Phosphotransferase enzyme family